MGVELCFQTFFSPSNQYKVGQVSYTLGKAYFLVFVVLITVFITTVNSLLSATALARSRSGA